MTTIHLAANAISQTAPISLHIYLVTTSNITAAQVRRLVNKFIVSELGTGLIACEPELVIAQEQIKQRVPVGLSLPTLGDLGEVGTIEVDALTGTLLTCAEAPDKIIQHANRLYHGATLQAVQPRGLPACARMVLPALGKEYSAAELARAMDSYGFGRPASRVTRLEKLGYQVEFGPFTLAQLQTDIERGLPLRYSLCNLALRVFTRWCLRR